MLFGQGIIVGLLSIALYSTSVEASEDMAIFSLEPAFTMLSQAKARKLYRGKTKHLQGKRIELSDWPKESEQRMEFYSALLGKNSAQMNAHWASLSFSGKARPPKEISKADINALLVWMSAKPHRIGYAPVNLLPENATIIYVVRRKDP
ncbi:hypothetical protein EJ063_03870 [Vibrio aquaticus]|uniref:Phosphate ABC transporter substrate-binding protein n=1 Tax=Vibrio aquaticus TaxID=2496559 RepID=A0A432D248_9VIBR|nr:hypothetical protein EJ063_03870 [Vibrio aquaticus]